MARNIRFERDHGAVGQQLLLGNGAPDIQGAIVGIANGVKPPGAEVVLARSYGPKGRLVVHIIDRTTDGVFKDRAATRRAKRQSLQQALGRVGGKFRKGGGNNI